MYGCYESLKGGNISEAMVDLTGGIVQTINIRQETRNLFEIIKLSCDKGFMLGCAIEVSIVCGSATYNENYKIIEVPINFSLHQSDDFCTPLEGHLQNGLITGHAYSITKATTVVHYKVK